MTDLQQKLSKLFHQEPDLEIALLFGSAAKNTLRPDSDVDIAISKGIEMNVDQQIVLRDRIAHVANRPVDLLDLESAHGFILKQALTLGIPLRPSQPKTLERLLKRLVYEQEDLAPQIQQAQKNRVKEFANGK
jgi:predicted nucleotidyltransferase